MGNAIFYQSYILKKSRASNVNEHSRTIVIFRSSMCEIRKRVERFSRIHCERAQARETHHRIRWNELRYVVTKSNWYIVRTQKKKTHSKLNVKLDDEKLFHTSYTAYILTESYLFYFVCGPREVYDWSNVIENRLSFYTKTFMPE